MVAEDSAPYDEPQINVVEVGADWLARLCPRYMQGNVNHGHGCISEANRP